MTTDLAEVSDPQAPALDDNLLIPAEVADAPVAEEPAPAPVEEPAPPAPPAEPVLSDTLAKAAKIQQGEDVTLTAAEVRQLQRYEQSQKDQEVSWSRAEEQRRSQVNELATAHTKVKTQIKGAIQSLTSALTGQPVNLDDLTQRGIDATIDPLIDTLANNAERIVLEPVLNFYKESLLLTAQNLGPLSVSERRRIASLDESGVLTESFRLGREWGKREGQSAAVPAGKVLVDKAEYDSLKTAQTNEQRATNGERVPPRPSLPRTADGKPASQIALAGAGLAYDPKALQAELDALSDAPLIPS